MYNIDEIFRKKLDELYGSDNIKVTGIGSICSTCKYFDGKSCAKGRSFGGFATKLTDCCEWEVCNG